MGGSWGIGDLGEETNIKQIVIRQKKKKKNGEKI